MAKQASPPADDHPPAGAKMPTAGQKLGVRQRLRQIIPNPRVILQLGARYVSETTGESSGTSSFGFDGVSLKSHANYFTKVVKKTFFDMEGTAVIQSHDDFQHWSNGDMDLASASSMSLFAKQHLWVVSGMGDEPIKHPEAGEDFEKNSTEEYYENLVKKAKHARTIMGDIGEAIGVAKKAIFWSTPSSAEKWSKFVLSMGEFAYSEYKKTKKHLGLATEGPSQLTLYGKDGIGLVSPEEISLIANDGTKIFGKKDVNLMAGVKVGIDAGAAASIFAVGEATLTAGGYADIKAGREVGIAALHGPVQIKGRKVEIGNTKKPIWKGVVGAEPTTEIESNALNAIEMRVGEYLIKVEKSRISIAKGESADPEVTIEDTTVMLQSEKFHVILTPQRAEVGTKSCFVRIKGGEELILIEGDAFRVNTGPAHIVSNQNGVEMGVGGNAVRVAKDGTVKIRGSNKVSIG